MVETLGRYRIDGLVAEGGMARILRAKTEGVGGVEKTVALKCLKGSLQEDDSFVQMLLDEARITVRMTHKNIGQVYGLEHEGDKYFMVMEYIDGTTLAELSKYLFDKNRVFPMEAAVFITMEICSGLSYAHRMLDENGENLGIVHRDVNPQNVCISREGEVKLIDFGIAKAQNISSETQAGTIKGKFNYMSPEQARGDRVDQRADVFALGAVLYEMLCGHMLYPLSLDDARLRNKTRMADFIPIESYLPDIPEKLKKIIAKALTRDVNQRFATSRDFLLALTQFFHDSCKVYDSINLSMLVEKFLKHRDKPGLTSSSSSEFRRQDRPFVSQDSRTEVTNVLEGAEDPALESSDTAVISAEEARNIVRMPKSEIDIEESATSVYSKSAFESALKSAAEAGDAVSSRLLADPNLSDMSLDRSIDLEIKNTSKESTVMVKFDDVGVKKGASGSSLFNKLLSLDEKTLFIATAMLAAVLVLALILFFSSRS